MAEAEKTPLCPKCASENTRWIPYGNPYHDGMSGNEPAYRCRTCHHTWGDVVEYNFSCPVGMKKDPKKERTC